MMHVCLFFCILTRFQVFVAFVLSFGVAAIGHDARDPIATGDPHTNPTTVDQISGAGDAGEVNVESKDPEPESGHCSAQAGIVQAVLSVDEAAFIRTGAPRLTSGDYASLPPACKRWENEPNCCFKSFFDAGHAHFDNELRRLNIIHDTYENMINDHLVPVASGVPTLMAVQNAVTKSGVIEVVTGYILGCEDQIRLHFAAMQCELCDPQIWEKLTDGKYLAVDRDTCTRRWANEPDKHMFSQSGGGKAEKHLADWVKKCKHRKSKGHQCLLSCRDAPQALRIVADRFKSALGHWNLERSEDSTSDETSKTQESMVFEWMMEAQRRISRQADIISFYEDKQTFCDRLALEGYVYQPVAWGDLDKMHPAYVSYGETQVNLKGVDRKKEISSTDSSPAECKHGNLVGDDCVCAPCWAGLVCDIPVEEGPLLGQQIEPLVADGEMQTLALAGCKYKFDLQSQLSHVKLVRAPLKDSAATDASSTAPAKYESSRCSSASSEFEPLAGFVPSYASAQRLEWQFRVSKGKEGRFLVCYCYGPCGSVEGSSGFWYSVGHMIVASPGGTRPGLPKTVQRHAAWESPQKEEENVYHPRPQAIEEAQTECDDDWTRIIETPSVRFARTGPHVIFECQPGFANLHGPRALVCKSGQWYVNDAAHTVEDDLGLAQDMAETELGSSRAKQAIKSTTSKVESTKKSVDAMKLRPWKDHEPPFEIPRCFLNGGEKPSVCKKPDSEKGFDGGVVYFGENGIARYRCLDGRTLRSGKTHVKGKTWERYCMENSGEWIPPEEPRCLPLSSTERRKTHPFLGCLSRKRARKKSKANAAQSYSTRIPKVAAPAATEAPGIGREDNDVDASSSETQTLGEEPEVKTVTPTKTEGKKTRTTKMDLDTDVQDRMEADAEQLLTGLEADTRLQRQAKDINTKQSKPPGKLPPEAPTAQPTWSPEPSERPTKAPTKKPQQSKASSEQTSLPPTERSEKPSRTKSKQSERQAQPEQLLGDRIEQILEEEQSKLQRAIRSRPELKRSTSLLEVRDSTVDGANITTGASPSAAMLPESKYPAITFTSDLSSPPITSSERQSFPDNTAASLKQPNRYQLQINAWPIKFTDDLMQNRFIVNECWLSWDCHGNDMAFYSAATHRFRSLPNKHGMHWLEASIVCLFTAASCTGFILAGSQFCRWLLGRDGSKVPP